MLDDVPATWRRARFADSELTLVLLADMLPWTLDDFTGDMTLVWALRRPMSRTGCEPDRLWLFPSSILQPAKRVSVGRSQPSVSASNRTVSASTTTNQPTNRVSLGCNQPTITASTTTSQPCQLQIQPCQLQPQPCQLQIQLENQVNLILTFKNNQTSSRQWQLPPQPTSTGSNTTNCDKNYSHQVIINHKHSTMTAFTTNHGE